MRAFFTAMGALSRVSLMTAMQYRTDFLLDALTGIIRTAAGVVPILLVYGLVPTVGGWTWPESLLVIALFFLLTGIDGAFIEPNLGAVVEGVRDGSFDLVLMKPLDAQLLVTAGRVYPGRLWDIGTAAILGGYALWHLPAPGVLDWLVAIVLLVFGIGAMYSVWLLAISTSFWLVKVDNLRFLLWSVADAGRWPVDVYGSWVRWALLTVIPVALVTTLPAMALKGSWSLATVALGTGVGAALLVVSRLAWRSALSRYTSASS